MASKKTSSIIDIRHWILTAILVAFAATNGIWYVAYVQQAEVNDQQTVDIYKLQQANR